MKKLIFLCLNLTFLVLSCQKEATTIVRGKIQSISGQPVSDAKITITNKAYSCWNCYILCNGVQCGMTDKITKSVITDKNGNFAVEFLDKEIDITGQNYFYVVTEKEYYAKSFDTIYPKFLESTRYIHIKPQAIIRINFKDNVDVNIGEFDGIYWEISKPKIYSYFIPSTSQKLSFLNYDLNKELTLDWYSYKIMGSMGGVTQYTGKTQVITPTEQKIYDLFIEY